MKDIDNILIAVREELERATSKFGPFHSLHEGYAVILEELDELWDEIKCQMHDPKKLCSEAIQVAAMAIRLIYDFGLLKHHLNFPPKQD